jgi:methylenetetrahydrofolate dehydrogenase (NADP+) / methenyltetrahydrofolate cyclohydrolase
MSNLLSSREIVASIKQRQIKMSEELRAKLGFAPKLAIVVTTDDPTIGVYVRMKRRYGADLDLDVDIHRVSQKNAPALIGRLNNDKHVTGMIVQLPLENPAETDAITALVAPSKDVDALGSQEFFEPATPLAILWLLQGYDIDLKNKKVVLVGRGKLVGAPLERILKDDGVNVTVVTKEIGDLAAEAKNADVIITATGVPALISADMLKAGAVVVDAGVASENGKTVGDVALDVYERQDVLVTPQKGGVGPLTVCALFENTLKAAADLV